MTKSVVLVPGGIGGTGGLSIDVANLAVGLAGRGWEVTVAGAAADDQTLSGLEGVRFEALRRLPLGKTASAFALRTGISRVLREHPHSVVHVFGCMPSYLTAVTFGVAVHRRLPLVWTPMFHPLRERVWSQRLRLRPMQAFDAIAPFAGRLADAVGAATETEAGVFRRAGTSRVSLLPPVVLPTRVEPSGVADDFRRKSGIDGSPLVVLVASRDERRKGLDVARQTFEHLETIRPDARAVVVGLAALQHPLPANTISLGRVDDRTLTAAYRAADVVFVPSLFEAFSRVVIEAWQQETPVVVSDGVALAPVVAENGAGRVVPYGNAEAAAHALGEFLGDAEGAQRAGRAGRLLVEERFELGGLLDAIEKLYLELASERRARSHRSLSLESS